MERFDAIVIGSGQAGTPLSLTLAQAGRNTALVERQHGGTCINEGCTPSKAMIASARVAYLARRAADYGVNTGSVTIDEAKGRLRKRAIVDNFRDGSQLRIENTHGLTLIFGLAKMKAAFGNSLEPTYLSTLGVRAARPGIPGLESVLTLDKVSIMELDVVPEHLLVIGGGYVGLEFGQMFRGFGSQVTIIHSHPQLLTREDPDVAEEITRGWYRTDARLAHGSRVAQCG